MNKKAQVTLETVFLLIVFVAGFLAMYGYLRKAIQGNWKTNMDSFSGGGQYEETKTDEFVSDLQFISPKIKVDIGVDNITEAEIPATQSGYLEIPNWGVYKK